MSEQSVSVPGAVPAAVESVGTPVAPATPIAPTTPIAVAAPVTPVTPVTPVASTAPVAVAAPVISTQVVPGSSMGETVVQREVVEKIAAAAARSVPGVADLGGDVARFLDSVLDKVGLDEVGDATRGVHAIVKGVEAKVTVVLVLKADGVVPDVTSAVRTAVVEALQKYGLQVTGVDIKVDDITMA
jgi:uncharacterized alkaline shock family protein YloU